MERRHFLQTAALAATTNLTAAPPPSRLGICTTSYMTFRKIRNAAEMLEHCHALGAAGIQAGPPQDPAAFRARAEKLGMWYEGMTGLPRANDGGAFEAQVKACKAAGATVIRAGALGGRRYETFGSMADWKKFVAESKDAVRRAVPVLEREGITMGLENHKDWTLEEHLALLKEFESPRLGVCLDFGNNISLLDDPRELVEKLAPYAATTHVKDMAYEEDATGFLMSEVPLGDGRLDLKWMIETVRKARPQTRFVLEMITRNPLVIPCLTDKYWATFTDRQPTHLARTLAMVRKQKSVTPLPRFDRLSDNEKFNQDAQWKAEENNVKTCLNFGREQLAL